ncbi:MAG: hypothetical protein AB1847_10815 [bacterium]
MPKRFVFAMIITVALLIVFLGGSCSSLRGTAAYDSPKEGIPQAGIPQADNPQADNPQAGIPKSSPPQVSPLKASPPQRGSKANIPAPAPGQPTLISGWKAYRNSRYGYEIRYPGTWYVREDNPNTPGIPSRHILQHTDFSPAMDYDQPDSQAFFCSVIVWENHLELPIEDWLAHENPQHPALLSGQTLTVGNKKIIRHEPQGNAYYINDWMADNDRTYQVFYCEPSKKHAYTILFNLMLETLRFTSTPPGSTQATLWIMSRAEPESIRNME